MINKRKVGTHMDLWFDGEAVSTQLSDILSATVIVVGFLAVLAWLL